MNPCTSTVSVGLIRFDLRSSSIGNQSGSALFVGLIFLVILSLLGVTALQVGILEERMAGNSRDRNLAFQAAESALRDAELDIKDETRISGGTGADALCTNGLCCNVVGLVCQEPTAAMLANYHGSYLNDGAAQSVKYGTYTAATALTGGLAFQPRYLIEPFYKNKVWFYRITARGYGINANTQVTLEEVYKAQ